MDPSPEDIPEGETLEHPQLSVIIPCFNAGPYLSEAIRSVLDQESSVGGLEVLLVDDHSPDPATRAELARWSGADDRVRVLENTGRRGAASTRNVGIRASRGRWVGFLDADDVWVPGGLEALWRVVETEPEAEWVSADLKIWSGDGSQESLGFFEKGDVARVILRQAYESGQVLRLRRPVAEFLRTCLAWTGAALVRRELLLRLNGFEPSLKKAEDVHLWIRLAHETDFFFVPQVVALYRQHPNSLMHESEPPEVWGVRAYKMLLREPTYAPYRSLLRQKLAHAYAQNAIYHRRRGERVAAICAGLRSVLYGPASGPCWRNLAGALLRSG